MGSYRIPDQANWPVDYVNEIITGDSLEILRKLPDNCIALATTSPPYWNAKDYEHARQIGQTSYEKYISDMLEIWKETERVLIPNGKLAIVTPILPISKSEDPVDTHTRRILNLNTDIEISIVQSTGLQRYSLFIWQKQTSVKMFGSYPHPPNIYEDNTIEFINVFVKPGKPPAIHKDAKVPSKITQDEWRNLTMQVWPMYPADVKRYKHPAPYPVVLPQRLIKMYSFARAPEANFHGDIVLDMFNGSGSTSLAARATGRNYIGIDLNSEYSATAKHRLKFEDVSPNAIMLDTLRVRNAKDSSQQPLFTEET